MKHIIIVILMFRPVSSDLDSGLGSLVSGPENILSLFIFFCILLRIMGILNLYQ